MRTPTLDQIIATLEEKMRELRAYCEEAPGAISEETIPTLQDGLDRLIEDRAQVLEHANDDPRHHLGLYSSHGRG